MIVMSLQMGMGLSGHYQSQALGWLRPNGRLSFCLLQIGAVTIHPEVHSALCLQDPREQKWHEHSGSPPQELAADLWGWGDTTK